MIIKRDKVTGRHAKAVLEKKKKKKKKDNTTTTIYRKHIYHLFGHLKSITCST